MAQHDIVPKGSSPMADILYRRCCGAPDAAIVLFETHEKRSPWTGPGVSLPPPLTIIRDVKLAEHEASHAAVAHGLGLKTDEVRIDPAGMHSLVETPLDLHQGIALSVAGPLNDALRGGWRARTGTLEFEIVARRILACWAGQCDQCQAVRAAFVISGANEPPSAFRILRRIERQVAAFLSKPEVEEAVTDLATALMTAGSVSGEDAHAILSQHVQRGSFTLNPTRR